MIAGIPLLWAIYAKVSAKRQKIPQDEREPNAKALSKYNLSSWTIPCSIWSTGCTGKILYASLMSILDRRAPTPKYLIHLTACFRVSKEILNSCLSMPSLTLDPWGAEWWVITRYSIGFVSRFSTSPSGLTMKSSDGGCCKENGPDTHPSANSLRIKAGKVSGDSSIEVRLPIMLRLRSPVYPNLKPVLRPFIR